MVNNQNPRLVVPGACNIKLKQGRQKITNGPVYDLGTVQKLVRIYGVKTINDQAEENKATCFDPELTDDKIAEIILSLRKVDHYQGSERCGTTVGLTVDADEYVICWNGTKGIEDLSRNSGLFVYLKLGYSPTGTKCLIVSVKPSVKNHRP